MKPGMENNVPESIIDRFYCTVYLSNTNAWMFRRP